ncbi:MAG: hypothetical protein J7521_03650 [Caulobacter sp.]|nr:hypothetical protein [Caulobacter sp.]
MHAPRLLTASLAAGLGSLALGSAAQAQDKDWEVNLTPYVWVAFPKGDVHVQGERRGGGGGGGGGDSIINASFDDVKLSGVFTGTGDIRYKRFGVLGDLTYYEIKSDSDVFVGPIRAINGEVKVSGTKGLMVGYWRVHAGDRANLDLLAGVHYLGVKVGATVNIADASFSGDVDKDLWDPVIGVRGQAMVSKHFGVRGLATYGGGGDSDSLYELQAYATYRFSHRATALAGYRYYSTKWADRRLDYDVSFSGPLIGLNFTF